MPLTAIIVDDEQLAREELDYLLKSIGEVEVIAAGKNGVEAVNLVRDLEPDLLFLDVQMPGLDGFGVIKRLLEKKMPMPQVVFATAFDQYAVKAFEVNAIDYLLKPFDKKRVAQAVDKARRNTLSEPALESAAEKTGINAAANTAVNTEDKLEALVKMLESRTSPPSKVVVRSGGRLFLVDQKDICFASIGEGIISVVTNTMEGQSNCRTLEELLGGLDSHLFWRAHRSFVVNINRIKEVVPWFKSSYQLRMDDRKQTEIPVSRAQTKRLRELFGI